MTRSQFLLQIQDLAKGYWDNECAIIEDARSDGEMMGDMETRSEASMMIDFSQMLDTFFGDDAAAEHKKAQLVNKRLANPYR